jgi:hypothetical protein
MRLGAPTLTPTAPDAGAADDAAWDAVVGLEAPRVGVREVPRGALLPDDVVDADMVDEGVLDGVKVLCALGAAAAGVLRVDDTGFAVVDAGAGVLEARDAAGAAAFGAADGALVLVAATDDACLGAALDAEGGT